MVKPIVKVPQEQIPDALMNTIAATERLHLDFAHAVQAKTKRIMRAIALEACGDAPLEAQITDDQWAKMIRLVCEHCLRRLDDLEAKGNEPGGRRAPQGGEAPGGRVGLGPDVPGPDLGGPGAAENPPV